MTNAHAPDWFRYFPRDWRDGCVRLNLEEEGLYSRVCNYMYLTMAPVPGDDATACRLLNVNINKYRKVLDSLIEKGKLFRAQGMIINERVLKEIEWTRAQMAKKELANRKRSNSQKDNTQRRVQMGLFDDGIVDVDNPYAQDDATNGGENTCGKGATGGVTPQVTPPVESPQPPQLPHDQPPGSPQGLRGEKVNEINDGVGSDTTSDTSGAEGVALRERREEIESVDRTESLSLLQNQESALSEFENSDDGETASKPKRSKRSANEYTAEFEAFWKAYPDTTNNSKSNAFGQWKVLTKKVQADVMEALPLFAEYCKKEKDYRCVHAERFLKYRRWESYLEASSKAATGSETVWWQDPAKVAMITEGQWRGSIAKHANGIWRVDKLGPPPGSPNCLVPKRVVDELRLLEIYNEHGIAKNRNHAAH